MKKEHLEQIIKEELEKLDSIDEDGFDAKGNLIEEKFEEPLNEAVFGGVGIAILGKLFVFLFKALQSKDQLTDLDSTIQQSALPAEAKEISTKVVDLLNTVEKNAPVLDKAAEVTGMGGNLNPLNWKANALIALVKKAVQSLPGKKPAQISDQSLDEKAVSRDQQEFFGVVRAMQKGKMPKTGKAGKAAKEMSVSDVKDFAGTKHKGLPEKKRDKRKK